MITEYVLGLAFSKDQKNIVLLTKINPEILRGKLNGPGAKVEKGETPYNAMIREFQEETGVYIEEWNKQCKLLGDNFLIHVFNTFTDDIYDVKTVEKEKVGSYPVKLDHLLKDGVQKMTWLTAMALDPDLKKLNQTLEINN